MVFCLFVCLFVGLGVVEEFGMVVVSANFSEMFLGKRSKLTSIFSTGLKAHI